MAFDKNHTSLWMKIVIVFFAVVLVVSLCLPFFSGCTAATTQPSPAETAEGSGTSSDATTVADVEAQYATLIASLEDRLENDPTSMAYLANLGNAYMDCAMAMRGATDADANEEAVAATFFSAVDCYDRYLAQAQDDPKAAEQDSVNTVTVDRAVCLFYSGSEDKAVSDLKAFLDEQPDFAMGWYNLGAFYEQQGDTDAAREAYNKVLELDPDGTAAVSSYANLRLMIMDAVAEQQDEAAGSTDGESPSQDGSAAADAEDGAGEAADDTAKTADDAEPANDSAANGDPAAGDGGATDSAAQ